MFGRKKRGKGRWSPDVVQAMKGVERLSVQASRHVIASQLWHYGEDELAERSLAMTDEDHAAIMRISAVYENPKYPLPVDGVQVSHGHVGALAAIAYFEGSLRPLNRSRRRPERDRPARFDPGPPDARIRGW